MRYSSHIKQSIISRKTFVGILFFLYLVGFVASFNLPIFSFFCVERINNAPGQFPMGDIMYLVVFPACKLGLLKYLLIATPAFMVVYSLVRLVLPSTDSIKKIRSKLSSEVNIKELDPVIKIQSLVDSKLLGAHGYEVNYALGGNFENSGNEISYFFIGNTDFAKSILVQKLSLGIPNFYLYNRKPLVKIRKEDIPPKNKIKDIFDLSKEDLLNSFSDDLVLEILNYYNQFMGISIEVLNGYLLILTGYPNLDSGGRVEMAVEKYRNIFSKSIALRKKIEKHGNISRI